MLLLDAGDALSPSHGLSDDQRPRVVATAGFIVDAYGKQGVDAMAVGDRDLALGAETLKQLAGVAQVPFVATNLVDAAGQPVFRRSVLVARGGMRVLVLGLVGERAGRMAQALLAPAQWRYEPVVEATKKALAEVSPAPDLVVVLSQLASAEEAALQSAVPEARVFLGGDAMGTSTETAGVGAGVSASGGQKGKHVGVMTITWSDPRGPSAPLVDPGRRAALEAKKANAERRIENLDKLIAQAREAAAAPPVADADAGGTTPRPRRQIPVETYERQLAGVRAELQLALNELEAMGAGEVQGNSVTLELVPMEPKIIDEPKTKAAVDEFRKTWPDPTKGPPPQPAPPGGPVPAPPGGPVPVPSPH